MGDDLTFFHGRRAVDLAAVAAAVGADVPPGFDPAFRFEGLAPPASAARHHVTLAAPGIAPVDLATTRAGLCIAHPTMRETVAPTTCVLVSEAPQDALRRIAVLMDAGRLDRDGALVSAGIDPRAHVSSGALVETRVVVGPGAVVDAGAEIGMDSVIGAYAFIGAGVRIGRRCTVESHATITNALVGDGVAIRAGARVGQAPGGDGAARMPPLAMGRVIVQDDCLIGANGVIERGALGDTVLGERCRVAPLATVIADTTIERFTLFP